MSKPGSGRHHRSSSGHADTGFGSVVPEQPSCDANTDTENSGHLWTRDGDLIGQKSPRGSPLAAGKKGAGFKGQSALRKQRSRVGLKNSGHYLLQRCWLHGGGI